MRSTKAQRELMELKAKLRATEEKLAVLEREHADVIAELRRRSPRSKTYQSKLARMEKLLDETVDELATTVDVLTATRQALTIVCGAASSNAEQVTKAVRAEESVRDRLSTMYRKIRELTGTEDKQSP